MRLIEVDVVGAQPAQAVVDLPHDRLAGQAAAIGPLAHRVEHLGGDDHVVAGREVADRSPEDFLAAAVGVAVGGVEEVDPELQRLADQRPAALLVESPRMLAAIRLAVGHATETQAGDFKAGRAKLDVFHRG
jgi:hypothetical protein